MSRRMPVPIQVVTRIVIDATGQVAVPDLLTCFADGPVAWLIINFHGAAHRISIDPGQIINSGTKLPENPLTTEDILTKTVPAGSSTKPKVRVILATVAEGFDGQSYTYEISLLNLKTGTRGPSIDPDLDVVDPGSGRKRRITNKKAKKKKARRRS